MAKSKAKAEQAETHFKQGLALHYKNNNRKAIPEFQKAITLNQDYANAYYWIGQAYYFDRQYENAIDGWKKYLALNPNDVETDDNIADTTEIYYFICGAYEELEQYDNAIDTYKTLAALSPDNTDAYYSMGKAYEKFGQKSNAIDAYKKYLALDPDGWLSTHANEAISILSNSKYPFSAHSWEVLSKNIAVKQMDKSAFLHHGTAIPKEIAPFFKLPKGKLSEPRAVTLEVGDVQYEANIQMDTHDRFRLFWQPDLVAFIKQSYPDFYSLYESDEDTEETKPPQMRFRRLRSDVYSVQFIDSPEPEPKAKSKPVIPWTVEEFEAAIVAYFQMLNKELNGESFNKAKVNRELRASVLSGRTKGSVELRMQNISSVLQELCHPIIKGYVPMKNVGTKASKTIKNIIFRKQLLNREDYEPTADAEKLDKGADAIRKKGLTGKPKGQKKPKQKQSSQAQYERDPAVKAWVLENANGICELCNKQGPFKDKNGDFFLEVHHVKLLADKGADTIENAAATCPNCHKKCHYSEDTEAIAQKLRNKIDRIQ
jgi:5-methylcytosine-specific restriction enzyme A